jgi:hypothetical protein
MSSTSRTNGRPALAISSLAPLNLELPESGNAWMVCPDCRHWCEVARKLVQTHKVNGTRCPGSAQLLRFDLTPARHAARRRTVQEYRRTHAAAPARQARALSEGRAPAGRLAGARTTRRSVEVKARTAMAAAFEAAFEKFAQVPTAPALHQIAARRLPAAAPAAA